MPLFRTHRLARSSHPKADPPVSPARAAFLRRLLAMASLAMAPGLATAQAAPSFPNGPVTMVVPYAAGGLTDNLARALAQHLTQKWGQPVLIDNKPGGGTSIGTAAAARADADGHTLLVTSFGFTTMPFMMPQLPYKNADFTPLAMIANAPAILYVHPSVPANNIPELIQHIRGSKEPFTFASSGNGSSPHIGAELFASEVGIEILHIPYKGNGPAINDLIGGRVNALFDSKATMSFVEAGRLKALGITSLQPSHLAPGVTPVAQQGVPELADFATGSWFGVLVPAGVPRDIQDTLYADIRAVLETKPMQEAIDRSGVEPVLMTQDEFAAYLKAEDEKWGPVIRDKAITSN